MVAVGRGNAPTDVINSRFVTLAIPFWIGLIGLWASLWPALGPRWHGLMFAVVRVAGPVLAALLLIGVCKFLHFDPLPPRALVCVRDYQAKCHSVLLGETLTVLLPQYLSIFADGR